MCGGVEVLKIAGVFLSLYCCYSFVIFAGKSFSKHKDCEDIMNEQRQTNTMKSKKFRRRSLDESLINPIKKALVGANRNRRQSTTEAAVFQRENLFYNSDRRRKKSDNEIFARFQDTTKERLRTAVKTRPSSCKIENEASGSSSRKNTPTMLRRISRHLIRAYTEAEIRNSISEYPNENEISSKSYESPLLLRYNGKSYDTSSLSTTDSGIESRDDKTVSSDEKSDEDDQLEMRKVLISPSSMGRSFSFDDLSKETAHQGLNDSVDNVSKTPTIRRQFSLREERLKQISASVSPSPMYMQKSLEKLNNNKITLQKGSENYSSDEKISSSQSSKGSRKKKKILQPLVKRIRKVSRNDRPQQQKLIDNSKLEEIVLEIIGERMKSLTYDHKQSSDRCRTISTALENALKLRLTAQPGNPDYKVVAVVYIGETRDQGICFATQCSYAPQQDLFATATYQNEDMYVCSTVMCSKITN